jgi:y4mF family transcriptional regulator
VSEIRIGHWTTFGAAIRDARRAQSLTQTELAERAGVSRSWLAKLESGHRGAEFEQILRVVSALGLTLSIRDERAEPATPSARSLQTKSEKSATSKTTKQTVSKPEGGQRMTSRKPVRRKSTGTIRIRVDETVPAISAAAAARLLERHTSALEDRRSTWDDAALKGNRARNG